MVINPDGSINFEGATSPYQSGGARAAAPGADLAAVNRAARVAKYGPEMVSKMETAGSTFGGPAAPSVATATNVAPVATSEAASTANFGQRALKALRTGGGVLGKIGRGVGAAILVPNMALSALKTAQTPTEEYEKRLGIGPSNIESPGLRFLRDLGVRGAGALTDLGNQFNLFSGAGVRAAAPGTAPAAEPAGTTIPAGVTGYPSRAAAPAEARADLSGATPIPALGTGAAVNTRTGRTLTFNTGLPPMASGGVAAAAPAGEPEKRLKLNVGQDVIDLAYQARDRRRALEAGKLGIEQSAAQARALAAAGTYMRGTAAMSNVGTAGLKVATDAMGNPQIVNLKTGTARTPVKEEDIAATMAANKMTRDQVIARLRAEGRME